MLEKGLGKILTPQKGGRPKMQKTSMVSLDFKKRILNLLKNTTLIATALTSFGAYQPATIDAAAIQTGKDAKGNDVPVMTLTPYTAATPDGLGQKGGGGYQTPSGLIVSPSLENRQNPKKDDDTQNKSPPEEYQRLIHQANKLRIKNEPIQRRIATYERALSFTPQLDDIENAKVRYSLGALYHQINNLEKSKKLFEESLNYPSPLNVRAKEWIESMKK
jgi:tetratricopeptide (TPR) repeat protein